MEPDSCTGTLFVILSSVTMVEKRFPPQQQGDTGRLKSVYPTR